MMRVRIAFIASLVCVCALLLAAAPTWAGETWSWEHPKPQSNYLLDVWAASDTEMFAVGFHGSIVRRTTAGWQCMTSPSEANLRAVWGFSTTDVYAAGEDGVVLHFDGVSWKTVPGAPEGVVWYGLWGPSSDLVYAVGNGGSGGVIYSWHGETWTLVYEDDYTFQSVHGAGDTIFAVGNMGEIARCESGVWSDTTPMGSTAGMYGVWVAESGEAFAVGDGPTIMRYHDIGEGVWRWTWMDVGAVSDDLSEIWGAAADDVYCGGLTGLFHYDGNGWTQVDLGQSVDVDGLGGFSAGSVLATSGLQDGHSGGQLWHYHGESWQNELQGVSGYLMGIWSGYGAQPVAVGFDYGAMQGVILQRGPSGWTSQHLGDAIAWMDVCGRSATDIYAVGWSSSARGAAHFDGQQWELMDSTGVESVAMTDVWCAQGTDVITLSGNTIYRYADGQWSEDLNVATDLNHSCSLDDVWGSGPDDIWAVGTNATIVHYDGAEWSLLDLQGANEDVLGVWGSGPDDVYFIGGDQILRYDGEEFSLAYDASQELFGIGGVGADNIWVVGDENLLVHFDGEQWQEQSFPLSPLFSHAQFEFWGMTGTATRQWLLNGTDGILARVGPSGTLPPLGALLLTDD